MEYEVGDILVDPNSDESMEILKIYTDKSIKVEHRIGSYFDFVAHHDYGVLNSRNLVLLKKCRTKLWKILNKKESAE